MRLPTFLHWNLSIVALFLGIGLLFSSEIVYSQQNISTKQADSIEPIAKIEHYLKRVTKNNTKEAESILQDLKIKWQSGFFSQEIKSEIYLTSQKMLANKMPAIPYFSSYIIALEHLIEISKDKESQLSWLSSVHYFLEHKNYREFSSYLLASEKLFTRNILFSDKTIQWKTSSNKYIIRFQKDSLKYMFPETELICYTKGDSTRINKTKGVYFPFTNTWEGNEGTLGWERANFPMDSVFVELKNYTIPMQYSKFSADSVLFHHLFYFEKPILGKLKEQVMASRRGNKAIYPKFESYSKNCEITNIFPNINFTGAILIEGAHFLGVGDEITPASLHILKNDTVFIKLRSTNFSIFPTQIRSAYSSISIRYKNDSIYHSGLHINYSEENKLLSFFRDNHGLTANPFYDTYHQINIYAEAVYWKLDEMEMSFDMAMGRTKSPARFESINYFSKQRFNRLQGIDLENPLQSLKHYSNITMSKIVYFDEYAHYLQMPKAQVQLVLLKLAHDGFLLYDSAHERAILGDKIDFYLQANAGNIDSDVISFKSQPNKNEANAYLQINNFDLQINGIDRIILSDSQNLIIEPTNGSIILRKNKDFSFDGKITAGRLSFATSHSTFDYDEFKLDMPSIDSLWFWVNERQQPEGDFERKFVQTTIRNLSGDLLIDHPSNKSGKASRNEYPIFNSKKDSYVYYDKKNIQQGAYSKERFYFHVNPFTFSSLNTFITDDISFSGYLASSGIFPDIAQALTVQEDYSLGFTKELPPEGIMAYGNKGRFYNKINLSNQGLKGNGSLSFINSTTTANDFLFLPDTMQVNAQSFELKPTLNPAEFPHIQGSNTYQLWIPYKETMQISTLKENLKMYDNETTMQGTLLLKPNSLSGKGTIQFRVAKMNSDNYTFKNQTFSSPKTNFSDIGNSLNNYSALANYSERSIIFISNDGTSKVEFPENQYICYMDQATWYMDNEITDYSSSLASNDNLFSYLTLRQSADTEYKGSNFISLHPQQDSLTFFSTTAKFNSKEKTIEAKGVHYIKIADAVIFPEQASITILKNAEMLPLKNSKIIANAVTKYHEINNATVKIKSRKSYSGSGDYVYIDKNNYRHPIHFKEIKVDTTYQTIAQGELFENDNFTLNPEFYFRGNVNLNASMKLLEFDGGFKIANNCLKNQSWIKFNSVIDPENLMIPIQVQPIVPDISRQQKYVGILYSSVQRKPYLSFFNNKTDYYDPFLLTAHGFLTYDENTKEFRISSKEKLNQLIRSDNYFSLKTEDCSSYGEGKIDLDVHFPDLTIETYGEIKRKDSITSFHIGAAIDFHFSNDALKHISDQFGSTSTTQVDNSSHYYSKMIAGFLGMDETEQYLSQLLMGNMRHVPDQLQHTILLNDLKLKWNTSLEAYISEGDFGIENFGKNHVDALVKGKIEIKKRRAGDELTIYFEINKQWYFFTYYNNVMQVLSSNNIFNEIIRADMTSKSEKNRMKKKKGKEKRSNYRYILSQMYVKDNFLRQLNTF